jgi:nascent polypeptide-associated complex subunit alpha
MRRNCSSRIDDDDLFIHRTNNFPVKQHTQPEEMSADDKKNSRVEEVEEDDDAPELMDNADADALGKTPFGKSSKRYAKAMNKMGLKQEANVFKVIVKKGGQAIPLAKTEVYRFPNTNTFVVFGEPYDESMGGMGMGGMNPDAARAAAAVTGGAAVPPAASAASAAAAAADDEEEVDAGDLGEKEIKLVMSQANVSRAKAIKALKNNKGDIVNTIMELTM